MNYPESEQIKQKIDFAQKILVNCHHNPDADSVGSALAMARLLRSWGKEVKILSPTEVFSNLQFLLRDDTVDVVDFKEFNFSAYDVFITLDSSSWARVCGEHNLALPQIPLVVFDHHQSNPRFGEINLVVPDLSANSLLLYKVFQDWGVELGEDLAEPLLAGIMGDTGGLRFPEADKDTYQAVLELMGKADKNEILFNLYQSYQMSHVNVWKAIMENITIDSEHKFVYSFIPKGVMSQNGYPQNAKSELADIVFQSIENTDFGMVGVEDEEGYVSVSFRSRTGYDVAKLAESLGGGGHKWASAARVYKPYDEAVQIILQKAREKANGN